MVVVPGALVDVGSGASVVVVPGALVVVGSVGRVVVVGSGIRVEVVGRGCWTSSGPGHASKSCPGRRRGRVRCARRGIRRARRGRGVGLGVRWSVGNAAPHQLLHRDAVDDEGSDPAVPGQVEVGEVGAGAGVGADPQPAPHRLDGDGCGPGDAGRLHRPHRAGGDVDEGLGRGVLDHVLVVVVELLRVTTADRGEERERDGAERSAAVRRLACPTDGDDRDGDGADRRARQRPRSHPRPTTLRHHPDNGVAVTLRQRTTDELYQYRSHSGSARGPRGHRPRFAPSARTSRRRGRGADRHRLTRVWWNGSGRSGAGGDRTTDQGIMSPAL